MKLTLNWLQNYVDIQGLSAETIADKLTMLGLEVDSVTPLYLDLADLKTGHVISAERHPDADKLTLCQVQIGGDIHQIICGAPNVREGLNVVVALPGTVLPGNFKITQSKIRGIASSGMICSERELGLSNDHDGIMELPDSIEHGQSFIDAMDLADTCVEVDLTPNRPDCTSVIGIAREIAGTIGKTLTRPVEGAAITTSSTEFSVEIESPDLCPRYAGKLIKNVTVSASPWWLKKRLLSVGLRPINNIVDITNFVMLEYGQPLHAFDFANLAQKKIIVRTPRDSENVFKTLDETERKLAPDMLLICDGEQPVAIAGVMGGLNSEVSNETTDVLLESACFNPVSVRKTARQLNLATDASYRFERGVDPRGTVNALNRAANLICELAGGNLVDDGIDCFPGKKKPVTLSLSATRTNSLLGITLTVNEISSLLESIGIECQTIDDDQLLVKPPSFRVDIEREADLVEEVARLFGYNNIPTTLPEVCLSYPEQDSHRLKRLAIARRLTTTGFSEAINYSFMSEKHVDMLSLAPDDQRRLTVKLLNPLSEEQSIMRTTLLPGLLENVRRNINFQKSAVKLFELGKIFISTGDGVQPIEKQRLAGVLSGNRYGESSSFHFKHEPVDILDAKGTVEFVLREMGLSEVGQNSQVGFRIPHATECEPFTVEGFQVDILIGDQRAGALGKIKSDVLRRFSIKHDVYFFDLDYDSLCECEGAGKKFTPLPIFPSIKRDIALVVAEQVSAGELFAAVRNSPEKLIENCEIFDVYQGDKIEKGCKSIALSITYRSPNKTLTEKNVEKSHAKIVRMLTDKFGGSFRNA